MPDNDGFVNGLMFGVAGGVSRHADELHLDFVGQNVINEENLGKLILQGWSRLFFVRRLYEPLLRTACIADILFIPVGLALTHMKF